MKQCLSRVSGLKGSFLTCNNLLAEVDTDLVVAAVVADDESLFVVLACVIP